MSADKVNLNRFVIVFEEKIKESEIIEMIKNNFPNRDNHNIDARFWSDNDDVTGYRVDISYASTGKLEKDLNNFKMKSKLLDKKQIVKVIYDVLNSPYLRFIFLKMWDGSSFTYDGKEFKMTTLEKKE